MTNTDTDGDKYVINGVEVTPVEAIEIITAFFKKQQFRVGRLKARITELEAAQRWIPVSEPPKVDGSYLLRTVFDEVYSSDFIARTETWVLRDYDSITHWMPLPQPPEVQE